ncbi:MAG: hypothetical protein HY824_07945 [Acidobacteria bacterium]|nr:hypothetical protein [Acidobacteriota bacterium]
MEVFVIPIGRDRYELYCEPSDDQDGIDTEPPAGLFGRLRHKFGVVLRAAEERQHRHPQADPGGAGSGAGPVRVLQDRALGWVAHRIAEQRLLWNLRRETSAVAVHPPDLPFEQVLALIRRTLQRDHDRHRVWLVIDSLLLVLSGLLALVPGPNVVAYYFAFRVVGHWLSMRGAAQGRRRVAWSGRPCPPLTDLRDVVLLDASARDARIHDIAARLQLRHLSTFVERVAVRRA